MLFTFISGCQGAIVIEQFNGKTLQAALRRWNLKSQLAPGFADEALTDGGAGGGTPVEGTTSVWCFSGVTDDDRFILTHIVATASV